MNTAPRHPSTFEVEIVGRAYPQRAALAPQSHGAAVALFRARRTWWTDLAAYWLDVAEHTATDAVHDVEEALEQSNCWAPKAA